MVIDFHTHVFPDKIAQKTINILKEEGKLDNVVAYTDGTLEGLKKSMADAKIDLSVVQPVVTIPRQFDSVNRFAKDINDNEEHVISFGGIHPLNENLDEKLVYLKESGFKGIKIHPDYQETFFTDENYFKILVKCYEQGLYVITHSGVDPAYKEVHCTPKMGREVLDRLYEKTHFSKPFIIFAHIGGSRMFDDVEKYLVGTNCYIDISYALEFCNKEQFNRIIINHGVDKIIFATDSPWKDQKEYLNYIISNLELSNNEIKMILGDNAKRLLSL